MASPNSARSSVYLVASTLMLLQGLPAYAEVVPPGPAAVILPAPISPALVQTAKPVPTSIPAAAPAVLPAPSTAPNTVAALTPTAMPAEQPLIFIDNDDAKAAAEVETFDWKEIPDEAGRTHISTGIRFPVRVVSELNSKTTKVGDNVEGQTKVDIKIGGKLIAAKGTRVVGHVFSASPARRMLVAEVSPKRWWRANGAIGIQFDQMITNDGEHIPLIAKPAKMPLIVENKNEGRVMGVNSKGEVVSPLSIQLKEQAIHWAIRGAASAGGIFSMGAVPVAYGLVGAINPSFAFMHPVGLNVHHRRLKGAAMGFVNGLPGGFLIADGIIKGEEASIKPGDEFLVEFKKDFTGEPASADQAEPDADKSVHGEIVKQSGSKKTKKIKNQQ